MKAACIASCIRTMALLSTFGLLAACAASGPGGDLNEVATVAELEARLEAMDRKVSKALKQSAAAKIDASTALVISSSLSEDVDALKSTETASRD